VEDPEVLDPAAEAVPAEALQDPQDMEEAHPAAEEVLPTAEAHPAAHPEEVLPVLPAHPEAPILEIATTLEAPGTLDPPGTRGPLGTQGQTITQQGQTNPMPGQRITDTRRIPHRFPAVMDTRAAEERD